MTSVIQVFGSWINYKIVVNMKLKGSQSNNGAILVLEDFTPALIHSDSRWNELLAYVIFKKAFTTHYYTSLQQRNLYLMWKNKNTSKNQTIAFALWLITASWWDKFLLQLIYPLLHVQFSNIVVIDTPHKNWATSDYNGEPVNLVLLNAN